jgi:hypothetical protein
MWESDSTKVHIAGLDADGNRMTDYARGVLCARLFGGKMFIDVDVLESSKAIRSGLCTTIAIYDHCGHQYRTWPMDKPKEVSTGRWSGSTVAWTDIRITLHAC